MTRFTHSIHDLRTMNWAQVSKRRVRESLDHDERVQVVRWDIDTDTTRRRSYIVMTSRGGLYAVFFYPLND